METADVGTMLIAVAGAIAALAGICALIASVLVGVSRRLIGFRLPFAVAFKATVVTTVVTFLFRGVGRALDRVADLGFGWALVPVAVVFFLAWYLSRYVQRPDGSPLDRREAYRLAIAYGVLLLALNLVALALLNQSA